MVSSCYETHALLSRRAALHCGVAVKDNDKTPKRELACPVTTSSSSGVALRVRCRCALPLASYISVLPFPVLLVPSRLHFLLTPTTLALLFLLCLW